MSGPKRGMVAGQPIQTQAQSKEFDEGYERVFGKGTRERGRFVYRDGQAVRVGEDWTDAERRAQTATEELLYGGGKATDGTPINSRKRFKEYLRQNGLTHASDYSPGFREKTIASRERETEREIRQIVDRDVHKLFGG